MSGIDGGHYVCAVLQAVPANAAQQGPTRALSGTVQATALYHVRRLAGPAHRSRVGGAGPQ